MWLRQAVARTLVGVPTLLALMDNTFYAAQVEGQSMQPLLNPSLEQRCNDVVLLSRLQKRSFAYSRGDVVVLTSPRDPRTSMIKRIIALPGDTVRPQPRFPGERLVLIPDGHVWVEGDHAGCSLDSNVHGPVPLGLVTAKAVAVIWPPSRWQAISSSFPAARVLLHLSSIFADEDDD